MTEIDVAAFRDFEREGWETSAPNYAGAAPQTTRQCAGPLLDAAWVGEGSRVLDVACGPGDVAAAALLRGAEVKGYDIASAMVEIARREHPDVEFAVAAAEELPEADGSVDAVVSNFGLPHFGDPAAVVAEACRVTRSGGRIAMSTWCPPDKVPFFGLVMGAVFAHGDLEAVDVPAGPDMFALANPEAASSFLEGLGLIDVVADEVPLVARQPAGASLVDFMRANTVRTRAMLDAQTPEAMRRIEEQVTEQQEAFVVDDEIVLPMPALVMAGTVP